MWRRRICVGAVIEMTRPKKQHFVPKLHLKHFVGCEPEGMIWTYDSVTGRVAPSLPAETAAETNFYSVQNEKGEYLDQIEGWLSGVESKASDPYGKLLRGEIPKGQQRADFATFMSSLFARSPAVRRLYGESLAANQEAQMAVLTATPERFESVLRRFEAETGPIDPDVRRKLYDFIRDKTKYTIEVSREVTLQALTVSDRLQELFFEMGWMVLESKDQHIITCDSPLTRTVPPETVDPLRGDAGFLNKRVQVTLPLSPTRCIMLRWRNDVSGRLVSISKASARLINGQRAYYSERFLYAREKDDGIVRLALKHRNHGHRMRPSGLINAEDMPPVKIRR
jgi:hypothetical protein